MLLLPFSLPGTLTMLRLSCLILLLCSPGPAWAQLKLNWNFEKTTYIDVRHVAKQTVNVLGQNKKTETTIHFVFEVKPGQTTPTGTVLDVTCIASEDSIKSDNQEENTFKGLVNQKFQVLLKPGNADIDIKADKSLGVAVFGSDAVGSSDEEKEFINNIVVAVLRVHLMDAYVPVPGQTVSPGGTWKNTGTVKVQPLALVTIHKEFVLRAKEAGNTSPTDTITWTSKVDLKPLDDEKGVLPFKVKDMKTDNPPTNTGKILWDTKAGRPTRIEAEQSYAMTMKMEINGNSIEGSASGHDTFVIEFSDSKPGGK